ncbi:hypothetical protein HZB02_01335 [Candidatus Woesearchaeota archaeon]|nr:hypothetical protein [Candidatus Woesearchaeota archaeon]
MDKLFPDFSKQYTLDELHHSAETEMLFHVRAMDEEIGEPHYNPHVGFALSQVNLPELARSLPPTCRSIALLVPYRDLDVTLLGGERNTADPNATHLVTLDKYLADTFDYLREAPNGHLNVRYAKVARYTSLVHAGVLDGEHAKHIVHPVYPTLGYIIYTRGPNYDAARIIGVESPTFRGMFADRWKKYSPLKKA